MPPVAAACANAAAISLLLLRHWIGCLKDGKSSLSTAAFNESCALETAGDDHSALRPAPLQLRNDGGAAGEDWVPVFKTEVGICAAEWAEWAAGSTCVHLPAGAADISLQPASKQVQQESNVGQKAHAVVCLCHLQRLTPPLHAPWPPLHLCRCAWTTQTPCGSPSRWTSASCAAPMSSARSSCRQAGLGWYEMPVVRRSRMRQAPSLHAVRSRPKRCPSALLKKATSPQLVSHGCTLCRCGTTRAAASTSSLASAAPPWHSCRPWGQGPM